MYLPTQRTLWRQTFWLLMFFLLVPRAGAVPTLEQIMQNPDWIGPPVEDARWQRLIELKKENGELASYPLEAHGYVHPESWLDQYRRILKLFENSIGDPLP
ncbi:MAG: hypothetical protein ACI87W_002805 [Halieaceae bacterium]